MAGPEFGPLQGHRLIIDKALCGLRSSGQRWHDRFSDCVRSEGFTPCRAEPDIWMRKNGNVCECVGVCVDDLMLALVDPERFVKLPETKCNFKFKGTGPLDFHLGADFHQDSKGVLCMAPKKCITKRPVKSHERMFGEKPKTSARSPLDPGDHPETDNSTLLDADGIQMCQSLIGTPQWTNSLCRFDSACAVVTMSSF